MHPCDDKAYRKFGAVKTFTYFETCQRIKQASAKLDVHRAPVARHSERLPVLPFLPAYAKARTLGVPKEVQAKEKRVCLTPASVKFLSCHGVEVYVERGAGESSGYLDEEYAECGATICDKKQAFAADIVCKIRFPAVYKLLGLCNEASLLSEGSTLLCFAWPEVMSEEEASTTKYLSLQGVNLVSLNRIGKAGVSCDPLAGVFRVVGNQAFENAISHCMSKLTNPRTRFKTNHSFQMICASSSVVVIGADVLGLAAAHAAVQNGCKFVRVFDPRDSAKPKVQALGATYVDLEEGINRDEGMLECFNSLSVEERQALFSVCCKANIIICTVARHGFQTPVLITKAMLSSFQTNAVIVDVAAGFGGNVEVTKSNEVVSQPNGVAVIGMSDYTNNLAREASDVISRCVYEILRCSITDKGLNLSNHIIQCSIICTKGTRMRVFNKSPCCKGLGGTNLTRLYGPHSVGLEQPPATHPLLVKDDADDNEEKCWETVDRPGYISRIVSVTTLGGVLAVTGAYYPYLMVKVLGFTGGFISLYLMKDESAKWTCSSLATRIPECDFTVSPLNLRDFEILPRNDKPLWTYTPVLFVGGMVGWVYTTYVHTVGFTGLAHAASFHLPALIALWSFYQVLVTDPGRVPEEWFSMDGSTEGIDRQSSHECKGNGSLRYCRYCKCYKPDRCHHDSNLNRCVLKMDHFCPWVNNVIGHGNHKAFLLFISYLNLCSLWIAFHSNPTLLLSLKYLLFPAAGAGANVAAIARGLNFVLADATAVFFSVTLSLFLGFHLALASRNETTIELLEKRQKFGKQGKVGLYDIGFRNNLISVFGKTWYKWLVPLNTSMGEGTYFPTKLQLD